MVEVDSKLLVELGLGGFAVVGLVKTLNWFATEFMKQVTTHNQSVVDEVKKLATAVSKNTEQTTFLLLALVGKDIVQITGKDTLRKIREDAHNLANGNEQE